MQARWDRQALSLKGESAHGARTSCGTLDLGRYRWICDTTRCAGAARRTTPPTLAAAACPGAGPGLPGWLEERLFDQRIVMVRGPLTGEAATGVAAALLTLDAAGPAPVQLHVAS